MKPQDAARSFDRGLSPLNAAAYGVGNIGAGMVFAFASAALPLYLASYGLPNALIGFLAQERSPIASLVQPIVGALSDRTRSGLGRRRPYLLVGAPAFAVVLILLATRPPLPVMILLLAILSPIFAITYSPYLALLTDLASPDQRARVGAVMTVASMAGQLGILWLASQLWSESPTVVFIIVAVGVVLAFGSVFFSVSDRPSIETVDRLRVRPAAYLKDLLGYREVIKYLAATFLVSMGIGGVIPFLTRFSVEVLGTDEATAFRLLMLAIGSTALFALPAGWLADRLGKKPVFSFGLALYGVVTLIGSQVQTVGEASVALCLVGIANAITTVLLLPQLADLIPPHRAAELTGLGSAFWEVSQPLGAVLAGVAADATETLRAPLIFGGAFCFVGLALFSRVKLARVPGGSRADRS